MKTGSKSNKNRLTPTKRQAIQVVSVAMVILAIAGFGVRLQHNSHAATPFLSSEPETGTITSPAAAVTDATASAGKAVKFAGSTAGSPRFAGNIPGRVFLGMAASETLRPTYDEALTITGPVYEYRQFKSGWYTASALNTMLDKCDSHNQYCVVSFKAPNNDWAGVAAGKYDADLDSVMTVARSRAKPFAFGVHHEPQGDGDAATWAAMQDHLVTYLSPVNDKMAFTTIANGFWWGPNHGKGDAYVATYYPDSLMAKMKQYKGIVAADFYDASPDSNGNYSATADRTSMKVQSFTTWARAKGLTAVGAGEFGNTSGADLTATWKVIDDNRDIWGYANYFNSLANSSVDWRLIPDSYPAYNTSEPLDLGGTPVSEARLNAFKAALAQSAVPH